MGTMLGLGLIANTNLDFPFVGLITGAIIETVEAAITFRDCSDNCGYASVCTIFGAVGAFFGGSMGILVGGIYDPSSMPDDYFDPYHGPLFF